MIIIVAITLKRILFLVVFGTLNTCWTLFKPSNYMIQMGHTIDHLQNETRSITYSVRQVNKIIGKKL